MLPPLRPDSELRSRYHILGVVGQGGMGSIYRAEDRRLAGRYCAIKEVQIDRALSPSQQDQARQQFEREATILARLDHPNLPKVSDFFSEGNRDYLVMDYVPGEDLRQKIEEARSRNAFISEQVGLGWIKQLCAALGYLHSQNPPILHRDIKPANIKLTPDGLIKLVDFGLVKLMTTDEDRTITVLQGRGTASYIPLEQYGGDSGHTDIRSDLYSLGATLYHLLTGEPPVEAKARFLKPESFRAPRAINPMLSLHIDRAIMWAIAMHPDDRPPTVEALSEALFSSNLSVLWKMVEKPRFLELVAPVNRVLALMALALLLLSCISTFVASTLASPR